MDIEIRVAREEDVKELLNIYAYYVANTAITFEHEVPTVAEFTSRIKETLKQYPYLVALIDGKMLYEELERILAKQNIINVYAGIASPVQEDEYLTRNSEYFHESIGYQMVARYHECASKFGKWYDLIEMEKIIGERSCPPKEFVPFKKLIDE